MFLLPVFCYVGVEMKPACCVCDRARADIHSVCQQRFLAREPGPLTSPTTRRCEGEVHSCCLGEAHNAFNGCAWTSVAGRSEPMVKKSHHLYQNVKARFYLLKTNPTSLCCSFERRVTERFSSLAVVHIIKMSLFFFLSTAPV